MLQLMFNPGLMLTGFPEIEGRASPEFQVKKTKSDIDFMSGKFLDFQTMVSSLLGMCKKKAAIWR